MTGRDQLVMTRREATALLAGLAALLATGPAASAAAAEGLDRATFLQVSGAVTGTAPDSLTALADQLMAEFSAPAQRTALLQLASLCLATPPDSLPAALHGTPLEPVARALAAAWYTGTVGAGTTARLISYEDALAWRAAGYEAVPGQCAGEFGAWSDPPPTP